MTRSFGGLVAAASALALMAGGGTGRASAAMVTVNFSDTSTVLGGPTTPATPGTYVQAIFTRLGDHEVEVQFTVPSGAVGGLYLDEAAFQFNTNVAPTFTRMSGPAATTGFNTAGIALVGSGGERFNTNFDFPNTAADRVEFGRDSVYSILFDSSLTLAADLSNLFTTPNASGNPYAQAVHIAGYPDSSSLTGQAVITAVPEPSTLALVALGGACLIPSALIARRRRGR